MVGAGAAFAWRCLPACASIHAHPPEEAFAGRRDDLQRLSSPSASVLSLCGPALRGALVRRTVRRRRRRSDEFPSSPRRPTPTLLGRSQALYGPTWSLHVIRGHRCRRPASHHWPIISHVVSLCNSKAVRYSAAISCSAPPNPNIACTRTPNEAPFHHRPARSPRACYFLHQSSHSIGPRSHV